MTVKELATQMSQSFETRKRNDDQEFYCLKDGSPSWMQTVCQNAHGDMSPDDWRYKFIVESVNAISEYEGDPEDAEDGLEASIYTHELTGWLHSRVDRISWMDEATSEFEKFDSFADHLARAQWMEMNETFRMVLDALQNVANGDGGDDE